jgi:Protein of unknown function (DUF3631)
MSELQPVEPESAKGLWKSVREVVDRFVVFQRREDLDAVALWVLHTWAIEAAETTLYLWVSSPLPACGKSRLLEVLKLLAGNAEVLVIPTAPSIFRLLDAAENGRLTILLDEIDKVYGYGRDRSELTGVIDQGNRRSGRVPRNVGTNLNMAVKMFPVFCPKALAGIEKNRELLPDTVRTRSVAIRLHKRGSEPIDWFFTEEAKQDTAELRDRLQAWAEAVVPTLREARPALPEDGSLTDRQLEAWRPMFAIADLAGAEFGEQMRRAAAVLHHQEDGDEEMPRDLRLIRDCCEAFDKRQADQLLTEWLVEELVGRDDEDSPWRDLWGSWGAISYDANKRKSIGRRIANTLRPYGIAPKVLYFPDGTRGRGYERAKFEDARRRWL